MGSPASSEMIIAGSTIKSFENMNRKEWKLVLLLFTGWFSPQSVLLYFGEVETME